MDSQGSPCSVQRGRSAGRRKVGPRARAAALVAGVLALAACGTTPVTPGGVGTSAGGAPYSSSSGQGRGVDAADGLTAIPFEPNSCAVFESRAKQVVDRMRSTGAAAAYATSLVLLSSRIVETGYPTDDLKTAFSSYAFRAGPTLAGAARAGAVTTADATKHPVDLMSAQDTLAGVVRLGIGCDGNRGGRVRSSPEPAGHGHAEHEPGPSRGAGLAVLGRRALDAVQGRRCDGGLASRPADEAALRRLPRGRAQRRLRAPGR